jgi:hypothetical protein
VTFPRTEAEIFAAAKERAAQRVGQSRIARVRVSRVSRLSRRAATTEYPPGVACISAPAGGFSLTSG